MTDEKFVFNASLKKKLAVTGIVGVVLFVIGLIALMIGGGHEEASHGVEAAGHAADAAGHGAAGEHHGGSWITRVYANLWINNVYFTGVALIGVFFVAVQYVAQAGWSAPIKRIPLAFGNWLPVAGILMLVTWLVASHDLFHWTHEDLYVEGGPHYDEIIAGKKAYLNTPFYLARMVIYFAVWFLFFRWIRKEILAEDIDGNTKHWKKLIGISAGFIVFFAVSSSMSAWDWILSIDTHWFSTMIGWYVFASWFVTGLATITLIIVYLKEAGHLSMVNSNHLHDLGKFVFAFSIFWTYIWVSQYLLIYYANIPEESVYFMERLNSDQYAPVFYVILIMNFFFPFLALMTRDAKRHVMFLKIVCPVVIVGHWLDFYLMVTPGTVKEGGGFGFLEIGMAIIFAVAFLFVVLSNLAKVPLVAKNHPMLEESMHHHI
jgi:hypothetical protein